VKSPCRKASSCVGVKRIETVSRDPRPLPEQPLPRGSVPQRPGAEGLLAVPWKMPCSSFPFQNPLCMGPKAQSGLLSPKPRQAPTPGPLGCSSPCPCVPQAPGSLRAERGGVRQSRQHSAGSPCWTPRPARTTSATSCGGLALPRELKDFAS